MKFFWITLGILFLIALLIFGTVRAHTKHEKLAKRAFEGRTPLKPEEFHKAHYENKDIPLEFIEKFLDSFSDEYGLDLAGLSPEDDFRTSLAFLDDVDSLGIVELKYRLEEEFSIEIPDEEASAVFTTVDHLITTVWKKTQETE